MKTKILTCLLLFSLTFGIQAKKFREYDQMDPVEEDSAILLSPPEGYDPVGEETSYWVTLDQVRDWMNDSDLVGLYFHAPDNESTLSISGGDSANTGANILLKGGAHADGPEIVFRNGESNYGKFNDANGALELMGGLTAAGPSTFTAGAGGMKVNSTNVNDVYLDLQLSGVSKTWVGFNNYYSRSFINDKTSADVLFIGGGLVYRSGATTEYDVYHEGNKPTASDVGLGNVDNTSDADKPISTAQAAGLWPQFSQVVQTTNNVSAVAGRMYINTNSPDTDSTKTLTLPSPAANVNKVIGFGCRYNLHYFSDERTKWSLVGHINGRSNNTDFQGPYYGIQAGILWCDGNSWWLLSFVEDQYG